MDETKIEIDLKDVLENLTCPICYDILIDPVMEMPNQHLFCKKCISEYTSYSHPNDIQCPVCKAQIESFHTPLLATNLISLITIKCKFCDWNGKFPEYKNHKKECEEFIKIYKNKLNDACEKIKDILSLEIDPHLKSEHEEIYNDHVKNWDWLSSDKKDWKWWWWATNDWWENKACKECMRVWVKYRDDIEKLEIVRKEALDYLL